MRDHGKHSMKLSDPLVPPQGEIGGIVSREVKQEKASGEVTASPLRVGATLKTGSHLKVELLWPFPQLALRIGLWLRNLFSVEYDQPKTGREKLKAVTLGIPPPTQENSAARSLYNKDHPQSCHQLFSTSYVNMSRKPKITQNLRKSDNINTKT